MEVLRCSAVGAEILAEQENDLNLINCENMSQSEEGEAVAQGAEVQPPVTVEAINEVSAVREETRENTVRVP